MLLSEKSRKSWSTEFLVGTRQLHVRLDSRLAYTGDYSSPTLCADGNVYSGAGKSWQVFVTGLCLDRSVAVKSGLLKDDALTRALHALVERGILVEA
jgi:hypothetical protein